MRFSAKNMQNIRLAHPLWELAPPREILDPPLLAIKKMSSSVPPDKIHDNPFVKVALCTKE